MSYSKAKAEAIGKARDLRRTAYEVADVMALKHNLTEKQRLRLREEIATCLVSGNNRT